MEQTRKPVSAFKVILLWTILIGNLVFWVGFWGWRHRHDPASPADADPGASFANAIILLILSCFFLGAGCIAYLVVLFTNCLTFNFTTPFLPSYKGKLYLAKIVVPSLLGIGAGLMLGVFLGPVLKSFGVQGQMTFLVPLFLAIVPLQVVQMWVNLWVPITRSLIAKRLAARNIAPAQLATALLIGISDPTRSSFKKMTLIEDDMGALWLTPQQLIYWGDSQEFAVTPEQLVQIERRADSGSTTMLSGMAHVILHVRLPGGSIRQIRLHAEGQWTLGRNRKAMESMAHAIANWHNSAPQTQPAPAIV